MNNNKDEVLFDWIVLTSIFLLIVVFFNPYSYYKTQEGGSAIINFLPFLQYLIYLFLNFGIYPLILEIKSASLRRVVFPWLSSVIIFQASLMIFNIFYVIYEYSTWRN